MKRKISHFKLGLFALAGAGIGFAALIWVGTATFFQKTTTYAVFFDTSVEGLQRGAVVKYRGVKIGEVSSIEIAQDDRYIEVLASIERSFKVDQSMFIQLSQQGLTGQSYLSLHRLAKGEKVKKPELSFQVKYPILPGRPSEMSQIESTAKDVMKKIKEMDLGQLAQNLAETSRNLNAALSSGNVAKTLDNIHAASTDLRTILHGLSGSGRPQQWRAIFKDIAATADALRTSTAKLSAEVNALPPDVFAKIADRMDSMVTTGEKAVNSWDRQVDQSLALIEKSVVDINRLVADMEGFIQSLKENPGQILQQPRSSEPFAR